MNLTVVLFMIPGFVIGLTIHEASHAITSRWLGDNLAGKRGRITLNPLKHLSPLGTLMLFIAGFGWGNPVPINLYNYKHPKRDYLLSSLAGPASNILLAMISLGLMYVINWMVPTIEDSGSWVGMLYYYSQMCLRLSMFINLVLAAINLVPIPPLDGSKIWPCLIPGMRPTHSGKMMWVWVIVLIVMLKTGVTGKIIDPIIEHVSVLAPEIRTAEPKKPEDFPADLYAPPGSEVLEYDSWAADDGKMCYYMEVSLFEGHPPVEFEKWLQEYIEKHGWQSQKSEHNDEWLGKKEESDSWLYQNRNYIRPDNDVLQVQLYRYVRPDNQEFSEWMYGYFYYYVNHEE